MEITERCAQEMGFAKNQYVAIQHLDTNHQHMHIVANRIGFDKKTVSDSNNFQKIAAFNRKMELRYNLKQIENPKFHLSKMQRLKLTHDKRKLQMQKDVKEALVRSNNYADLERLMKEKKYQIIKSRGIAFKDEKQMYVKGSELGFSLQTIERILNNEHEKNKLHQYLTNLGKQKPDIHALNHQQHNIIRPAAPTNHQRENPTLSKTFDLLIQPNETNKQRPFQFKARKKKRQRKLKL